MQLRIWKKLYLSPFIRVNFYTRGFTISFGDARIGWLTLGRRGVRGTLDTGIPGVYATESRRWDEIRGASRRRRPMPEIPR
jgi:hypothetical protein